MPVNSPGPNSTVSGLPVLSNGSPTCRPDVSSYTCMNAVSPSSRMISPSRPSAPTRTMSYIRAPVIPRAMTAGPAILIMDPLIAISLASIRNSAQLHIESDMLFNQSRDIVFAALQLRLRRREGDDDRQVAVAHQPGDLRLRALEHILVDRPQTVVFRYQRTEGLEGLPLIS